MNYDKINADSKGEEYKKSSKKWAWIAAAIILFFALVFGIKSLIYSAQIKYADWKEGDYVRVTFSEILSLASNEVTGSPKSYLLSGSIDGYISYPISTYSPKSNEMVIQMYDITTIGNNGVSKGAVFSVPVPAISSIQIIMKPVRIHL